MKITAFNGSPRAEKSNTHFMVHEFLLGCQAAGAEVQNIFLAQQNIQSCRGCFSCWVKTPGKCVIKDDARELLSTYMASDIVVFATPVFLDNVTGIMKLFIDRLIPLLDPHFGKDEKGESRHLSRYDHYPRIALISNCGYPEQTHFHAMKAVIRRMARNLHSEVIAEICRGEGEALRRDIPALKSALTRYAGLLRKAGAELVRESRPSKETLAQLEMPIVAFGQYVDGVNRTWDDAFKSFQAPSTISAVPEFPRVKTETTPGRQAGYSQDQAQKPSSLP